MRSLSYQNQKDQSTKELHPQLSYAREDHDIEIDKCSQTSLVVLHLGTRNDNSNLELYSNRKDFMYIDEIAVSSLDLGRSRITITR